MTNKFGPSIAAELERAEERTGHAVPVVQHTHKEQSRVALFPVGVFMSMENPHPESGRRRITLDASTYHKGEVWFAKLDHRSNFLVEEEGFMRALRIHRVRLRPFKLDMHGKISTVGSMVMDIPGKWQCPECKQSREHLPIAELRRMQNTHQPTCVQCNVPLVRIPDPLMRPDRNNEQHMERCMSLYEMFKQGASEETPNLIPRVWASYRVCDAPPAEAWRPHPGDTEAARLDHILRERYAVQSKADGIVTVIEQRGKEPGRGWRVWVGSALDGQVMLRSPIRGKVKDIGKDDNLTTIYVLPEGANDSIEACEQVQFEDDGTTVACVRPGSLIEVGGLLAGPKDWVSHDVEGVATLVVSEGSEVSKRQRLSEGFTIRPVKLAISQNTPGIKSLFMESTHDAQQKPAMRYGWLSWNSLTGGLSDSYGFNLKVAKDHVRTDRRDYVSRMAMA